ncbi:hypothetical protein Dip518_000812 [Parelusimicrobium proximum]|uniref:hypothetical protein n=1 Tax=Parelusimicrobium proximum TaxID=3228953 RepID=UPI003D16E863
MKKITILLAVFLIAGCATLKEYYYTELSCDASLINARNEVIKGKYNCEGNFYVKAGTACPSGFKCVDNPSEEKASCTQIVQRGQTKINYEFSKGCAVKQWSEVPDYNDVIARMAGGYIDTSNEVSESCNIENAKIVCKFKKGDAEYTPTKEELKTAQEKYRNTACAMIVLDAGKSCSLLKKAKREYNAFINDGGNKDSDEGKLLNGTVAKHNRKFNNYKKEYDAVCNNTTATIACD